MRPLRSTIQRGSICRSAWPLRDLWHRFYENQIADRRRQRTTGFAAYSDSGGLVMGHYASAKLPLWDFARQYVLADNFFMGAFGGSFFQSLRVDLRLCANLSERRSEPGQGLDLGDRG